MRTTITRYLTRITGAFRDFTTGQKAVALLGSVALLLGGYAVFRWVSAPSYAPLFSGLAPADASAVLDELNARGVTYQLADGGATIMVPRESVYQTRIALSGDGLPGDSSSGYSILDGQGLSTSQFQEQTGFKRAMEGELAKTIEAIDGVDTAVVHLAIPAKQVFSDSQDPTTASVLVATQAGRTLTPNQVQAVVNLVASSIDGLKPDNVTVADSTGTVLSAPSGSSAAASSSQTQQVEDFQGRMGSRVQAMLDRVLGAGNSAVQVTANLSFDKKVTKTIRYFGTPSTMSLSESSETYQGSQADQAGGVVGAPTATPSASATGGATGSQYAKNARTADNVMDQTVEEREAAPGGVESLHVGVVLDQASLNGVSAAEVQSLVASALGIDTTRGDTVRVSTMPFDRTAEEASAKELATAESAAGRAQLFGTARNVALVVLILIALMALWLRGRHKARAREDQDSLSWVDQLRIEGQGAPGVEAAAPAPLGAAPAVVALQVGDAGRAEDLRDHVTALADRQPEEVAALLRSWLVERP